MASVVWDFFKVSEENSLLAICNKCNAEVPQGGKRATSYNTSNLISHLITVLQYSSPGLGLESDSWAKFRDSWLDLDSSTEWLKLDSDSCIRDSWIKTRTWLFKMSLGYNSNMPLLDPRCGPYRVHLHASLDPLRRWTADPPWLITRLCANKAHWSCISELLLRGQDSSYEH